jgi:very-short-patch-repair endonuclease
MKSSPWTYGHARQLRWTTTGPERALWEMLRGKQLGLRFRRQHPIGPYILDFYCPAVRLCVEVDGPVHREPEQMEHDVERDAWLRAQDVRVLRF